MTRIVACLLFLLLACFSAIAAELIIEGSYEQGTDPLPDGPGTVDIDVYVSGVTDLIMVQTYLNFVDANGQISADFQIKRDGNGNPSFGYYWVFENDTEFPTLQDTYADSQRAQFSVDTGDAADFTDKTLAMTITYEYTANASGPYTVQASLAAMQTSDLATAGHPDGIPFTARSGRVDIGDTLRIIWVDDDAPNDPGPGNTAVSDPNEDGTTTHPYDAIQEAINAATDGDVIVVKDGTYTGSGNRDISFAGKAIVLTSENGPDNCTIDAEGWAGEPHRCFYFNSGEPPQCVLMGFTLTGGCSKYQIGYGEIAAGILCQNSSPSIIGNVICGNYSLDLGGGIGIVGGAAIIHGNTISANSGNTGGGIFCLSPETFVSGNVIISNTAYGYTPESGQGGGGVQITVGGILIDNSISDNRAACGAGVYAWLADICAVRNRITANNHPSPAFYSIGGGIALHNCGAGIIADSLISDNFAHQGGGLHCANKSFPQIANNTIVKNVALHQQGGGVFCDSASSAAVVNCVFWSNSTDFSGCFPTYSRFDSAADDDGYHNISLCPHFVALYAGDYHLKSYSPCIGAGSNLSVVSPADIEMSPRISFDTVDMGAYEAQNASEDSDEDGLPDDWELEHFSDLDELPSGDVDGDGWSNLEEYCMGSDPAVDASTVYVDDDAVGPGDGSINDPFPTIQEGIDASTQHVCVAAGTYTEQLKVEGKTLTICGGYNSDFTVHDPATYTTSIDASGVILPTTGRPITFESASGLLSGFTIKGGDADMGGGIFLNDSSVVVSDNIIWGNRALLGGGVCASGTGSPQVVNNTIIGNYARDGGGIGCLGASAHVAGNAIGAEEYPNEADRDGGGVYCVDSPGVKVADNTISFNRAGCNGGGIALRRCLFATRPPGAAGQIVHNTLRYNSAARGGGVACQQCTNVGLTWNVIHDNYATQGAGVCMIRSTGAELENNTIADNETASPF